MPPVCPVGAILQRRALVFAPVSGDASSVVLLLGSRTPLLAVAAALVGCGGGGGGGSGSPSPDGSAPADGGSCDAPCTADSAPPEAGTENGLPDAGPIAKFPLKVSPNGRYLVDQSGTPFRVHGDASWDAHLNLNLADLGTYLDDRRAHGFDALFTYVSNPVAYFVGASTPWAAQLGGPKAGTAALPFTKNASGGAWDGDPTFSHHDASFASPNDAYFAWVAQFVDEALARGLLVMMAPMYLGYGLGAQDGWYQTLVNAANTQSVCAAFGQYLAKGHGAFTGFASRPNIVWVEGGDTFPPVGSEGAKRALAVLQGMQAAGDTHLQTAHWQHDYLTPDQTDFAPSFTAYAAYTHGAYPTLGPTYAESRILYAEPTARPTWLLETSYWGEHGTSRAEVRMFEWGSALSTIGGTTFGFGPFWGFTTSPDGSTATAISATTAWTPGTAMASNQYVSKGGNWYRATTAGTTGGAGPSGNGTSIADGSVVWTFVATGGWNALLDEPAVLDMTRMGALLDGLAWYELVPSELGGMKKLVVAGGGSYASWSDMGSEGGGMDWVVSAATPDGKLLVAYVPDAHSGALTVDMTAMHASARARWYDPTTGAFTADASGSGYGLPDTGTHDFTTPGANAEGDHDWTLVLDTQ
jgi:hypothetical protein